MLIEYECILYSFDVHGWLFVVREKNKSNGFLLLGNRCENFKSTNKYLLHPTLLVVDMRIIKFVRMYAILRSTCRKPSQFNHFRIDLCMSVLQPKDSNMRYVLMKFAMVTCFGKKNLKNSWLRSF